MEIINLNKICGGCASVGLGSKLDTLKKDLEEGNTYSGELLTDEEVNTLNNICPVLSQLSLGTYINNMLTASKEGTEVENLTEEQIDMLNYQTCGGFETMEVGSKISDFVEEINKGGGGTVSSEAEFLTYNFTVGSDEYFEGVIDSEKGTITIDNETLTPLGVVTPSFTLSENAVATINGVIQTSDVTDVDLTQPVTYTVTAEDGTTKDWTIVIKYGPDTRHWDGENPEGVSKLFFKDAIDFSGSAYWESFKTEMAEAIDRPIEFTIFNIDCIGDLDISVGEISTGEYDIYLYDHSGNLLVNWRNLYEGDLVTKIDGVGSYESLKHPIGLCKDDIASSKIPSIGKVILDCVEISADE